MKKFLLYLLRWEMSTPILAICVAVLSGIGSFWASVIANAIGAAIFFWVDRLIFKDKEKK